LASIKELKAKFSATASVFRSTIRDVRENLQGIGTTTDRAMEDSNQAVRRFQRALEDLDRAIANSDNPQMFQALSQAIQNSQQEISQTGTIAQSSMQEIENAINEVHTEFAQLGDSGSDSMQEIENAINEVEVELQELGNVGTQSINGLEDSLENVSADTENVGDSAEEAKGGFIAAFSGMSGVVIGLVGAIGAAILSVYKFITASDDLKKSLNDLQIKTGATKDEMLEMEKSLINIYRNNYGESFYDIADAMAQVRRQTGLTGEALEDATEKAFLLRDGFDMEINESLKVTRVMMKQFGISADEAFTLLAQGQQEGLNYSDDLIDSFWEYSVYFKQLGFDAEGMWDVFKAGADGGAFNLDKVGDAIKELGIRVKDGSDASYEAFEDLGFNAKKITKEFAAGGDSAQNALSKLFQALGKIEDPIKRNTIGVALFGTQFEDLEVETILAMGNVRKEADMTADTLEKMAEIKFDSIGSALAGTWRIINAELLIPLQQKAMPGINKFVNMAKDLITGFIDMMRGNPVQLFEVVGKYFEGETKSKVLDFFLAIRDGINNAKEFLFPFKQALEGIFSIFTGDTMGGIDLLMKLGLSPAQVGAIVSGITLVKDFINTLWQIVSAAFTGIKNAAIQAWGFLAPYIMPLIQQIVSFIGEKLSQISDFWNQYGGRIMAAVQNAFNFILSIIQFIMPAVLFIIQAVWSSIKGVIDGALNIIIGLVKIFTGLFTGDWSLLWEGVKQLLGGALEFLWNLFNLMMIGKLLGGIKAFITGGINFFKNFALDIASTFKGWIDDVIRLFTNFRSAGQNIWSSLTQAISNTVRPFVATIKSLFSEVLQNATTIFNNVKNAIMHPIQTARDVVKGFVGEIKGFFTNMKLKLPDIKMPHFKIKNWSMNPKDWLKAMPSLGIDWYADGAVFAPNSPRMIGIGDADVPEAALPLSDTVLGKIGAMIAATMPQPVGEGAGDILIEVPVILEGREVARGTYKYTKEFQDFENERFR
jgi:TP901 family phage tail tape measure protein